MKNNNCFNGSENIASVIMLWVQRKTKQQGYFAYLYIWTNNLPHEYNLNAYSNRAQQTNQSALSYLKVMMQLIN